MFLPVRDTRASTLVISQSIKYRKNCLLEASPSKFSHQKSALFDQQNIPSLIYKDSKSMSESLEMKKQSRRKAGSIVKIQRNVRSHEKDDPSISRKELQDGSNYLNSKLQYNDNNEESIGVYKKLYEQNKVLNEALKTKLYQTNEKLHFTNPVIGLSNYSYTQENQFSRLMTSSNQECIRSNDKNQHIFNSKYQKMMEDYDKKKKFIKEQIQAMKQKSSLQNFSTYDLNPNQERSAQKSIGQFQKDSVIENSKFQNFDKKAKTIPNDSNAGSNYKGSFSDTKIYDNKIEATTFKLKEMAESQKEDEINKKFKAYQSKLQKHKDFEKRNPSVKKEVTEAVIDTSGVKNLSGSIKKQFLSSKQHANETIKVFIDLIGKQIEKDQEVRVLKHNLKNVSVQEIESVLKQRFEIKEYPKNFKLSTEEYDPFFQLQKSNGSVEQTIRKLIGSFDIAENFWKNLIKGRLNKTELEQVYDTLNYGMRDQITINQLARELSLHLGKTVRNREIHMVYERLVPLTKQNFIYKLEKRKNE